MYEEADHQAAKSIKPSMTTGCRTGIERPCTLIKSLNRFHMCHLFNYKCVCLCETVFLLKPQTEPSALCLDTISSISSRNVQNGKTMLILRKIIQRFTGVCSFWLPPSSSHGAAFQVSRLSEIACCILENTEYPSWHRTCLFLFHRPLFFSMILTVV